MNEYDIQTKSCLINRDKNAFIRVTTSLVEKSRYFVLLAVATVLIVSITIKVVSVVIVIFAVQFLKQLTLWEESLKIMYFGLATTAVTLVLVAFLRFVIQNTKSNFPTNPSQENLITEHSDCNSQG